MSVPAKTFDWRSRAAIWACQHLVLRRALPLAFLIAWGSFLTIGLVIHPTAPNTPRGNLPFASAGGTGIDYYQFWVVGQTRQTLRPDNIYSTLNRQRMAEAGQVIFRSSPQRSDRFAGVLQVRGRVIQTFSTPFLYAVVNTCAIGQYDRDFDFFLNLCLAGTVFSLLTIGWVMRFTMAETLLLVVMTLLWNAPLASDLRVGNVNQLQLAGVALYVLFRHAGRAVVFDIAGGVVLGFLVAFKPTLGVIPLLLTITWVIDGRWSTLLRQAASAIVAFGIAMIAGSLYLNSWSAWLDWYIALSDLETVPDISVKMGNYSLAQAIRDATSGPTQGGFSVAPILMAVVLVVSGIVLMLTRPGTRETMQSIGGERDCQVAALGCAVSVVALKLVWLHYYVLLLPLLLCVMQPGGWIRSRPDRPDHLPLFWPVCGLILALLTLTAVSGWPWELLYNLEPSVLVGLYICGAWTLMLMGLAQLWFPSSRM